MKKNYKELITKNFNDIKHKLPYPFKKDILNILKKENKLEQTYYYIENNKDYAFFILYKNKMNVFTFGKLKLILNINVIGYPCSLSNSGYITNNEGMLFDYIKTIKGAKLILNVNKKEKIKNMTVGETLPTCILDINYKSINEYLNSLRSSYRRRINIAINKCKDINIKEIKTFTNEIYQLYLNTYNKSNYKLEKLEKGFFDKIDETKIVFYKNNEPLGFVLINKIDNKLTFMLCGMNYKYDTTDLYYYMLYNIIKYAIENKCNSIDFGQTSEETKMKFGAILEERYFYAHHSNIILNNLVKIGKSLLEYKYKFPKYKVFKEKKV